jgi:hypothetical protein
LSARTVLYLHSSAGRYGADRQLALIARGLDRERYRPLVVLPHHGRLVDDLSPRLERLAHGAGELLEDQRRGPSVD